MDYPYLLADYSYLLEADGLPLSTGGWRLPLSIGGWQTTLIYWRLTDYQEVQQQPCI
ncbi:hypothetical protein DPMN_136511 [Dreissena polymorpha]|uniref:Uncharacterized protein n=1 Tax=Dreissena polymorpha TaxID=45954 RepID=A0A9D4JDU9_DREPO|nr:hypothetical protein DPMN_136072 [Dreissena polymorpha]KAH3808160.1 hypothetical protein DPMN_136511 [Dreissena polymorpha]